MEATVYPRKKNILTGVVICGGKSTRMGSDKAFTNYHGVPQYQYVNNLLNDFCDQVYISCNESQKKLLSSCKNVIIDKPEFQNAGPMTGLLSVISELKNESILLLGCDYPFINKTAIEKLIAARSLNYDAVCYSNEKAEMLEPLLAVYENSCFALLNNFYHEKNTSLQQFLKTISTKIIEPVSAEIIRSIDTKEQYDEIISVLPNRQD